MYVEVERTRTYSVFSKFSAVRFSGDEVRCSGIFWQKSVRSSGFLEMFGSSIFSDEPKIEFRIPISTSVTYGKCAQIAI